MPEKIDLGWDGNSTTVHPQAIVMPPNINREVGSNSQILRHRIVKVACGMWTVASEAQNKPPGGVWLANNSHRASCRGPQCYPLFLIKVISIAKALVYNHQSTPAA